MSGPTDRDFERAAAVVARLPLSAGLKSYLAELLRAKLDAEPRPAVVLEVTASDQVLLETATLTALALGEHAVGRLLGAVCLALEARSSCAAAPKSVN